MPRSSPSVFAFSFRADSTRSCSNEQEWIYIGYPFLLSEALAFYERAEDVLTATRALLDHGMLH